jgi:beta-glucosidase
MRASAAFDLASLKPASVAPLRGRARPDTVAIRNCDLKEVVELGLFDMITGADSRMLQTVTKNRLRTSCQKS